MVATSASPPLELPTTYRYSWDFFFFFVTKRYNLLKKKKRKKLPKSQLKIKLLNIILRKIASTDSILFVSTCKHRPKMITCSHHSCNLHGACLLLEEFDYYQTRFAKTLTTFWCHFTM